MNRTLFSRLLALFLCSVVLAAADSPKKALTAKTLAGSLTPERLDDMEEASRAFADRFVTVLAEACDTVRRDPISMSAAHEALRLKLFHCSSVYSIATTSNPPSQILNQIGR